MARGHGDRRSGITGAQWEHREPPRNPRVTPKNSNVGWACAPWRRTLQKPYKKTKNIQTNNLSLEYLNLTLEYLNLSLEYFNLSLEYLNLSIEYLTLSLEYLNLSLEYLNLSLA